MLRFSEVIWDICWPRLNRLNSCCHAILTSSTAPTQYQIAQTTWSTSIKPIKQIQPFRTSLLHGHDPFFFPLSNTRISSSFQTYRFSQPWRSISTLPWMDTSEWWSQCPPWRCSWAPPPSSCARTDPLDPLDPLELRMGCGGFQVHNWFNNCFWCFWDL